VQLKYLRQITCKATDLDIVHKNHLAAKNRPPCASTRLMAFARPLGSQGERR
jgi:hypothetical protein